MSEQQVESDYVECECGARSHRIKKRTKGPLPEPDYLLREAMARAWDEGHLHGCEDAVDDWCKRGGEHFAENPYRKEGVMADFEYTSEQKAEEAQVPTEAKAERDARFRAIAAEVDRHLEADWHQDQCACTPGLNGCLSGLTNRAPISWTTEAVLGAAWDLILPPGQEADR